MRRVIVIAILALFCTACKNNKKGNETTDTGTTTTTTIPTITSWPDSTRTAFITNCINNSKGKMPEDRARKVCTCMQGKIEAQFPNYADATSLTMQQMSDMAKDCVQ